MRSLFSYALAVLLLTAPRAAAAELKPDTIAAFDRYVRLAEDRMDADLQGGSVFLRIDAFDPTAREGAESRLRAGQVLIEPLRTLDGGKQVRVPHGLIHHWSGVAFIPGATVEQVLALLQDYDRHEEIYRPNVVRSKLIAREGDRFRFHLRFFMKKVISVVMNTDHEAQWVRLGADRAHARICSTRIAEVEHAGTPEECEKPVGHDNGFMWRLNTYWRVAGRNGGVYVECESITLSRRVPTGLGWLIGPFVTSIPKESLTFTMDTTRKRLAGPQR